MLLAIAQLQRNIKLVDITGFEASFKALSCVSHLDTDELCITQWAFSKDQPDGQLRSEARQNKGRHQKQPMKYAALYTEAVTRALTHHLRMQQQFWSLKLRS